MAAGNVAQAISDIRKKFPNMDSLSEVDVRSFIIDKILGALDWDLTEPGEVKREFKVDNYRADYALKPNGSTADVFIEAKRPGVELNNNHDDQLLKYCFRQAVNLGVLTNGRTWWLYLPKYEGPQGEGLRWNQKRFSEIDIIDGIIDGERKPSRIPTAFNNYLAKEKVSLGEAIDSAKRIIDDRERVERAKRGMVDAWNDMVTSPSEDLIKLLTESTFQVCNVKPGKPEVKKFLQNHQGQFKASYSKPLQPEPPTNGGTNGHNGKPSLFTFNGSTPHSVKTWKEVLVKLCELIYAEKQDEFDHIMSIKGRKNPYFSRDRYDLKDPEPIGSSGIFAETAGMNAGGVKERCRKVLDKFGYPKDCFWIE